MKSKTMQNSICLLSSLLLLLSLSVAASAQMRYQGGGRFERLGVTRVDGRRDHDSIRVYTRGAFRGIQLRVNGAPIELHRVVVHFDNGQSTELEVRDRIRAGGVTRVIDLPGNQRRIQNIEVWYGRENWSWRRPTLTIYGQR